MIHGDSRCGIDVSRGSVGSVGSAVGSVGKSIINEIGGVMLIFLCVITRQSYFFYGEAYRRYTRNRLSPS